MKMKNTPCIVDADLSGFRSEQLNAIANPEILIISTLIYSYKFIGNNLSAYSIFLVFQFSLFPFASIAMFRMVSLR